MAARCFTCKSRELIRPRGGLQTRVHTPDRGQSKGRVCGSALRSVHANAPSGRRTEMPLLNSPLTVSAVQRNRCHSQSRRMWVAHCCKTAQGEGQVPCLEVDNLSIKMALKLHGKLAELIHTDLHVQQLRLMVKQHALCCIRYIHQMQAAGQPYPWGVNACCEQVLAIRG